MRGFEFGFLILLWFQFLNGAYSATIHVSMEGNGDGSAWDNPLGSIQTAINLASDGDEIWVAGGVYHEQIFMASGVSIYGGFRGNESSLEERDWIVNETIIDANGLNNRVITATGTENIVLDGLSITGGNTEDRGGGVYMENIKSATIANCWFYENRATRDGGGIACFKASPYIHNCRITNNLSPGGGGGFYGEELSSTILNCEFSENSGTDGGGMRLFISPALVKDCTFTHNSGDEGAGATLASSGALMVHCLIADNTDASAGGGLQLTNPPSTVMNCLILRNTAGRGGAVYGSRTVSSLINCVIAENHALGMFGGSLSLFESDMTVTNCTMDANRVLFGDAHGIAIGNSSPMITNTILNEGIGDVISQGGNPVIEYSCVRGAFPGVGNIDTDPLFVDPQNFDYRLQPTSPCIDAGNPATEFNDGCQPLGLGTPRNDMGAYGGPDNCGWPDSIITGTPFVPSDIVEDNRVDSIDLLRLLEVWDEVIQPASPEDLFDDDTMNLLDLAVFQRDWGKVTGD